MIRKLVKLTLIAFGTLSVFVSNAQISSLPYTQGFETQFVTGTSAVQTEPTIEFVANWVGNTVNTSSAASRVYRDTLNMQTGAGCMGMWPTSSAFPQVRVKLNLTGISGTEITFSAKGIKNGAATDVRSAILYASTSIDGGTTFSTPVQIGDSTVFANLAGNSYSNYTYTLPTATDNEANVQVRFITTRGTGTGNAAKLMIDDVTINNGSVVVDNTPPTVINGFQINSTSLGIKFSEKVNATAENIANYTGISGLTSATRTASSDTVILVYSSAFPNGSNTVTIANIEDDSLNVMTASFDYTFTVGATGDTISPSVVSARRVNATTLQVIFNEATNATAENVANYTGISGLTSATRSAGSDTITLVYSAAFADGVTQNLTVANVEDAAGNDMNNSYLFTFIYNASTPNIIITEINYNDPSAGIAGDSLEFFEIYNNGSTAAQLGGLVITKGVVYTFPEMALNAGAYALVARNSNACNSFFGTSFLQWTSGGINNTGETIEIRNSNNDFIDSVRYNLTATNPWPAVNGTGPSMELQDYNADNNLGINWIPNVNEYGSIAGVVVKASPGFRYFLANVDTIAPTVTNAVKVNDTTIKIKFSEKVNTTAENTANYTGIANIVSAVRNANRDSVTVTYSSPFPVGSNTLTISNIEDDSLNAMVTPYDFTFTIAAAVGDTTKPTVVNARRINGNTIGIKFSERVSNATAGNTANYTGISGLTSATLTSNADSVTLVYSSAFADGITQTLTVANVADTASNVMNGNFVYSFIYNASTPNIIITEINYNDPSAGIAGDSLEFFEIYNHGSATAQLGGLVITKGVVYTFPEMALDSGNYALVARSAAACNSFFGTSFLQWTSGGINNTGETIEIRNSNNDFIDSVRYNLTATNPWPAVNGTGPSMELQDYNADNNLGVNWLPNINAYGSVAGVVVKASPGFGYFATVGVKSVVTQSSLAVYPNPFTDNISVNIENATIKITDMLGKEVISEKSVKTINTSALPKGMYVVKVLDDNGNLVTTTKVVKN